MKIKNGILAINVGSTSVKLAVFEEENRRDEWLLHHNGASDKYACKQITEATVVKLEKKQYNRDDIAAISARSGILKPVSGGTYRINAQLLADARESRFGSHASNLSPQIGYALGRKFGAPAYVVDPITTDEMDPSLKLTGIPWIERKSLFHALSQKAAARKAALEMGMEYGECNLIVAHMGGGISVGAHRKGRVVDVGNAIGGDGPMAPERAGTVPAVSLVDACLSGCHNRDDLMKAFVGGGGIYAHLNTRDMRKFDRLIGDGNEYAVTVFNAMLYSIAKATGASAAVLGGRVDSIVITGGLSSWVRLIRDLERMISFIAPVKVYTRNLEMEALASGALRVLKGCEQALEYPSG
ncbi:MAG: butyrate kinase [Verrucomicrobiota bacterium]